MNAKQRKAHLSLWGLVAIVLFGVFGAVLIVRERLIEFLTAHSGGL